MRRSLLRTFFRPESHTTGSSFVFIFRALRPCDQNSPISVWKPVYLLRAFVHTSAHMDGGWWAQRESQLCIYSFVRKEYTPFWRERHVRIPDHLCVWLKLKKEPEFPRNKKRIQSSGSDAREEEVRAWKHDVSFNRLATDYCILFYYNCKLGWACFLLFIFYFYSTLLTVIPFSQ